jgi:fatty-acyl-CoA synthase
MPTSITTLADVLAIERVPLHERIAEQNVYDKLHQVAAARPDQRALVALRTAEASEAPREITYRELIARITQAANLLTSLGVQPGQVVSLLVPLVPEALYALFGAMTAGVASPLNPLLEPAHLAGIAAESATTVLVVGDAALLPDIWPRVAAMRAARPALKAVLRIGGSGAPPPGVLDFEALLAAQPADHLIQAHRPSRASLGALFHTGGTTGQPKLARHTHGGLLTAALTNAMVTDDSPDVVHLGGLPLFHIGGALISGLTRFAAGQTLILPTPAGLRNPAVVRNYWSLVERLRPTVLGGVPTSLSALLSIPAAGHDLSSVRFCLTGASTLPVEVGRQFSQKFGITVREGYGMTEVHAYSTLNPPGAACRLGSVGLRVPYLELRIAEVDAEGQIRRTCAVDEIGHVLMRGPQVFAGYLNPRNDRGTLLADGWLDSGDLGRLDADGYLWLTGRAKDLIIRGGHNIDPQLIEQVLHQHPAVEIAAAVGCPDVYAGELPMAFVQPRAGAAPTAEELLAYCRQHMSERAANPVELVMQKAMPLTALGKIHKPTLRQWAAERVLQRALSALSTDAQPVRIEVISDATYGTVARVLVPAAAGEVERAALVTRVRELLGGYPLRHQVEFVEPA